MRVYLERTCGLNSQYLSLALVCVRRGFLLFIICIRPCFMFSFNATVFFLKCLFQLYINMQNNYKYPA